MTKLTEQTLQEYNQNLDRNSTSLNNSTKQNTLGSLVPYIDLGDVI